MTFLQSKYFYASEKLFFDIQQNGTQNAANILLEFSSSPKTFENISPL